MDPVKTLLRNSVISQAGKDKAPSSSKLQKLSNSLSSEFNQYTELEALQQQSLHYTTSLKEELNRLVANNSQKEQKLRLLHQALNPSLGKLQDAPSKTVRKPYRFTGGTELQGKLLSYEQRQREELLTNLTLTNTIRNEKQNLLVLKQRVGELRTIYAQFEKKHSAVLSEKNLAMNNWILAENQKSRYISRVNREKTQLAKRKEQIICRRKNIAAETEEIVKRMTQRYLQKTVSSI